MIIDPASNFVLREENSKNNTTNNDPRNHSSHLISSSDILLSFFGKSTKQLGGNSPVRTSNTKDFNKLTDDQIDNKNDNIVMDKKILKKSKINQSNVSNEIEEEKKEDEVEEKKEEERAERRNKQKAIEEAIRKEIEMRKMQKNGVNVAK